MYKIMYKIMGGGGLVFQDRYRLDRLAHMKKFFAMSKIRIFLKKMSGLI